MQFQDMKYIIQNNIIDVKTNPKIAPPNIELYFIYIYLCRLKKNHIILQNVDRIITIHSPHCLMFSL